MALRTPCQFFSKIGTIFQIRQYATEISKSSFRSTSKELIRKHTKISHDHLTPELGLYLITEECELWRARECLFPDPFWAFYWPGGQALSRYLLDSGVCCNRRVLDVGTGCGASAIAAAKTGASYVLANDINQVALDAVSLNASLNNAAVHYLCKSVIGLDINSSSEFTGLEIDDRSQISIKHQSEIGGHFNITGYPSEICSHFDYVLLGDLFYDEIITSNIMCWLETICEKSTVLLGDPGRPYFDENVKARFDKIAEYELSEKSRQENNGLTFAGVYKYKTFPSSKS